MSKGWGPPISRARLLAALDEAELPGIRRVATARPLSNTQRAVAALLSLGHTAAGIGERLGCKPSTVRWHIEQAADRIPGNLEAKHRLIVWYRGGGLDVLGVSRD